GVALAEAQTGVSALLEDFPGRVVNRLNGSMSNHSKPYQALVIREAGFRVPRTLITSDPNAAKAFFEECHREVVFKSLSGVRSMVRGMEQRDVDRLARVRDCPVQFQELVPGDNVRVHVVGSEVFATRARTEAVDYRYAGRQGFGLAMEAPRVPADVEE